jgi:hypothetical protein
MRSRGLREYMLGDRLLPWKRCVYGQKSWRLGAVSRALLPSLASRRTGLESELIQRVRADFVGPFTSLGWGWLLKGCVIKAALLL